MPGVTDAEAIEIRKNHVSVVKFPNESDNDFPTVAAQIDLMIEKAQDKVDSNWSYWEEIKGM